jgi:3-oxoacyl-[acyl-carrier-protein] synthase II
MKNNAEDGLPVISSWSAVSPFGIGREAFEVGIRTGTITARVVEPHYGKVPQDKVCLVPNFDVREVLGRKRTRSMDRVSGLAVTTVRELLIEAEELVDPTETAVVLGTSGTAQKMRNFTRSSLLAAKPFYVDPGVVPSGVMNCAAGLIAIWHQLKGPNATIATGRTAGLFALAYACRLLATGRARRAIVGAAEEYSSTRAWLEFHRNAPAPAAVLGEGCTMYLVEPMTALNHTSRSPLVEVLGIESQVCPADDIRASMRRCLLEALKRYTVNHDDVWAVCVSEAAGELGHQEREAVKSVFGAAALRQVPSTAPIGETASASAAFQIAALLSTTERPSAGTGRVAAITSVDPGGTLSCGLFRFLQPA